MAEPTFGSCCIGATDRTSWRSICSGSADLISRQAPLLERKRLLRSIMPRVESRVQLVDGIDECGDYCFRVVREHDLEGIVAKPKYGPYYSDGPADKLVQDQEP